MRKLPAALAACLLIGAAAEAEDRSGGEAGDPAAGQPVVVELYTSQGCSSCPPADVLFAELAERRDVLALALHVDYWDYIGWKDTFGSPKYTERQKRYARAAGHRTIYTPQMVIEGEDHVVGFRPMEVAELIAAHQARPQPAQIALARDGGTLTVALQPGPGLAGPLVVQMVRFTPEATVEIQRGENAGRTIAYANVVTDWRRIGAWDGAAPLRLTAPVDGDGPLAVILQQDGMGPIVAAAALR